MLLPNWSRESGFPINQITVLGDLKGVTMKEFRSTGSSSIIKDIINIDQVYIYILIFNLFFRIIILNYYILFI